MSANTQLNKKDWFSTWFNSPYYHLLYKHRDHNEAATFIREISAYLNITPNAQVLDVACGRGRHAITLEQLGFNVTGIDLSENNINFAQQFSSERLSFLKHDMRLPMEVQFDALFNLFTSFGYFNHQGNLQTLKAFRQNLKPYGIGVLDYLNVSQVSENLITDETISEDGIDFKIQRNISKGFIHKKIEVIESGSHYKFEEQVSALTLKDFETMFEAADLTLLEVLGDYKLNAFSPHHSPRLLLIFTV